MGVAGLVDPRIGILQDVQRKHEGLVIVRVLVQSVDPYIELPREALGRDTVKETAQRIEHEPVRQLKVDVTRGRKDQWVLPLSIKVDGVRKLKLEVLILCDIHIVKVYLIAVGGPPFRLVIINLDGHENLHIGVVGVRGPHFEHGQSSREHRPPYQGLAFILKVEAVPLQPCAVLSRGKGVAQVILIQIISQIRQVVGHLPIHPEIQSHI